jgi:hypothetical protein
MVERGGEVAHTMAMAAEVAHTMAMAADAAVGTTCSNII